MDSGASENVVYGIALFKSIEEEDPDEVGLSDGQTVRRSQRGMNGGFM